MKLGCSTLLFGGHDLDATLKAIAALGYEGIELCSIPGMGEHFKGGESDAYYEDIKAKIAETGMILESVGCSGALGTERFEPLMAAAAKLGAPLMTLGTGGVSDDEQEWQTMIERTRAALPVCEQYGVKLLVKPHVRASVYSIATSQRFIEEIASPWVGLNIDNTHLQRIGDDPIEAVAALKQWIFTGRIRDYQSDDLAIGPVENQIPGKGQTDVAGYFKALCTVPGLEMVTVEMVGAKDFELAEVQRIAGETLDALRSYR